MSKQIEKTRFSFTRSEITTLTVLAVIFVSGLIFQQIKRSGEREVAAIKVFGADTLAKIEVETLLREPGFSDTSDSSSLDQTGANSLTSTAKPLFEGEGRQSGSNAELTEPKIHSNEQIKNFSDSDAVSVEVVSELIHLNTATQSELETLPGIGPVLAGRIIDWRFKHNRFSRVEDLLLIRGIGKKRFEVLKPLVTVDP